MSLEQQLQQLPKPMLAAIVIAIAIVLFMVLEPPHTICDTHMANFRDSFSGALFPKKIDKKTYPAKILSAMESCRTGNSSGSCYEYLDLLKKTAVYVKNSPAECGSELSELTVDQYAKTEHYEVVEDGDKTRQELSKVTYASASLQKILFEAIRMMVLKAWGEEPPRTPVERLGWLRESEAATFCHIKDALKRGQDSSSWQQFEQKIMAELPLNSSTKAIDSMAQDRVRELSLFALPCAVYR
jgi:hypothetical protein